MSPLMSALTYRSLKCMKLLIKASILLIIFNFRVMNLLTLPSLPCLFVDVHGSHEHSIAQSFSQAGAGVNGKGCVQTSLVFATSHGGYTNFIKFLLKAGADPNIPDDVCIVYFLDISLIWYAAFHYILLKLLIMLLFDSSDYVRELFSISHCLLSLTMLMENWTCA